jgi:hypothetical protein
MPSLLELDPEAVRVPPRARTVAEEFLSRFPVYSTPEGARGDCWYACVELWVMMARAKVSCHVVKCEHRYDNQFLGLEFHCLVVASTGMWALDPTWCQLDLKSKTPLRVMSLSDVQKEWVYYRQIPFAELLEGTEYLSLAPRAARSRIQPARAVIRK